MIDFKDTYRLIELVERVKKPASFLLDTFFPRMLPISNTKVVAMEYMEHGRLLAPYIVPGSTGVNVARGGSTVRFYAPPMVAPKRVITLDDIEQRAPGEDQISQRAADIRANEIQARDFNELLDSIINRKNQMASEILTTGKVTAQGYADDGHLKTFDTIDFGWEGKFTPATSWNQNGADIYSDLQKMSEWIQERIGTIPTVAIVGRKVANYLLNNKQIMKWLSIPSRENFALMSIQPQLVSPQIMRIGLIQSLNLEIYSYSETYTDESGNLQKFFPDNGVLVAIPGFGSQLHGAVTVIPSDTDAFKTYSVAVVPVYRTNYASQVVELTLYSRFILVPTQRDSFAFMNCIVEEDKTSDETDESLPSYKDA